MKECRDCRHQVSEQALSCPHCGAPYPARAQWDGWGYEYKSKAKLLGLPLVHDRRLVTRATWDERHRILLRLG